MSENIQSLDEFCKWLASTGWLDSKNATVKIPPSVLKRLYDEILLIATELNLYKIEIDRICAINTKLCDRLIELS
jgi:hypothetical protein